MNRETDVMPPRWVEVLDANLVVTVGPSAGPGATPLEHVDRQRRMEGGLRSRLRGYRLLELSAGTVGTPPREAVHRAAVHVQRDDVPVGMLQWIVPGERDLTLTCTMACEAMPRLSDLVRALVAAAHWTSSSTLGPADGEEAAHD